MYILKNRIKKGGKIELGSIHAGRLWDDFDDIRWRNLYLFVRYLLKSLKYNRILLAYCTYVLSTHPDEQQKLCDEINSFFRNTNESGTYEDPNADNVNKLEYLDMFIKEVNLD